MVWFVDDLIGWEMGGGGVGEGGRGGLPPGYSQHTYAVRFCNLIPPASNYTRHENVHVLIS